MNQDTDKQFNEKINLFKDIKDEKPIMLSVSESAKIGGVTTKTIRRAIQSKRLNYIIINNRYYINTKSLIEFLHTNKKLFNKLHTHGIGKYVNKWE